MYSTKPIATLPSSAQRRKVLVHSSLVVTATSSAELQPIGLMCVQTLRGWWMCRDSYDGARLGLRAAGAPTPPSSAGRRRTRRHTTSLARRRGPASGAQAARSGSARLKNEWVRPRRLRVSWSRTFALDPRTTTSPGRWLRMLDVAISRGEVSSPSTPHLSERPGCVPSLSRPRSAQQGKELEGIPSSEQGNRTPVWQGKAEREPADLRGSREP